MQEHFMLSRSNNHNIARAFYSTSRKDIVSNSISRKLSVWYIHFIFEKHIRITGETRKYCLTQQTNTVNDGCDVIAKKCQKRI